MAVPFNIPDENNEVDVIINQLQSLLTQLKVAVRQNHTQISTVPHLPSRVRNNPGSQRHTNEEAEVAEEESHDNHNRIQTPEPFNNLAWLTSISQENINLSSQLTMIPFTRTARYRTISDSCDETKINITTIVNADSIQDWNQIGVALRKLADDFSSIRAHEEDLLSPPTTSKRGILSKLPGTLTGSIWTAMLCCVGWHLFSAR